MALDILAVLATALRSRRMTTGASTPPAEAILDVVVGLFCYSRMRGVHLQQQFIYEKRKKEKREARHERGGIGNL